MVTQMMEGLRASPGKSENLLDGNWQQQENKGTATRKSQGTKGRGDVTIAQSSRSQGPAPLEPKQEQDKEWKRRFKPAQTSTIAKQRVK